MEKAKVILGHSIIIILALYFLGVGAVLAQDIELIGSYEYLSLKSVAVDGNYAFLGSHLYGDMLVMDISDPANPELIYEYQPSNGGRKISIQDNFLYAACGISGMDMIDISNPLDILLVGHWSIGSQLNDVFVSGQTAYVAMMSDGIYILDISQPDDPYILGHYPYTDHFNIFCIFVSGDYACAGGDGAWGWLGIKIFDVSDPADPIHISSLETLSIPRDLIIRDNIVYLADDEAGLTIIDIADPSEPSIISNLPTGNRARALVVEGDLAYVADRYAGLSIINISDPSNPSLLSSLDTGGDARSIFQDGYYTFLIAEEYNDDYSLFGIFWYTQMDSGAVSGIVTNEMGEPLADVAVSVIDAPMTDITESGGDYLLEGFYTGDYDIRFTHPYYADTVVTGITIESGLMTYLDVTMGYPPLADVGVSSIISPIDSVLEGAPYPPITEITNFGYDPQTFDLVFEIYILNTDVLLFADTATAYGITEMTIDTIAFENTFTPGHATSYDLISYSILPGDEDAANDTATAICHSYLVYPVIEEVSVFTAPSMILDLYVSNNLAFLCTSNDLMIVDVSDPENPSLAGLFGGHFLCVSVAGDYAYLYSSLPGNLLSVVDISNPAYPTLVGSCDFGGSHPIWDMFVQGNYAFLTDHLFDGIHVVDIADPTNPSYLTTYDAPAGIRSVFVLGDYAYLSAGDYGLQILDISIPENPVFVGSYDTPGSSIRTFVENDYAYVADTSSLQILDISNPSFPVFTGQFDAYTTIWSVKVHFEYAYILDALYELQILDVSSPETPVYAGGYDYGAIFDHCVRGDYIYLADAIFLRILKFVTGGSDCQFIAGDANHNGINNELADVITMIGGYRGSLPPDYTCICPPHGMDFVPEFDVDGNCISLELNDVVRMIAGYRGTATVSSCIDCPGSR